MFQLEKSAEILHLINSLDFGGAEKILSDLVVELKSNYSKPVEIAILYDNNNFSTRLNARGIKVINLGISPKYNPIAVYRLIKLIKQKDYRIIHAHLFPAGFFLAAASCFIQQDIQLVFTEHSPYNRRRESILGKLLDKFTYARYRRIICVSLAVKKELISWLPPLADKVSVITNAIMIPKPTLEQKKIFDIIFIGRLIEAKGVDVLLTAIKSVKDRGVALKTAIVGQGHLSETLHARSMALKIKDDVVFLGNRDDVSDLLSKSRIFVLPSRWEGIPIALLEAMGAGLPVIASQVGGIPEVIDHQKNGLLIPPDDPQMLADRILSVLSDPAQMKRLGANARQKIQENYSIKIYAEKILNLYQNDRT